jgi:cyanophycinase
VRSVVVSADRSPVPADLDGASGIYVAGGLTPGYQAALTADRAWLQAAAALPYAGCSAGAAVAPRRALVGGWRARIGDAEVAVCDDGAGADLDLVEARDGLGVADLDLVEARDGLGLGLAEVMVDVHAAQWGTLARLAHAVLVEGEGRRAGRSTRARPSSSPPAAPPGSTEWEPPRACERPRGGGAGGGEAAVRFFAAGAVG